MEAIETMTARGGREIYEWRNVWWRKAILYAHVNII